MIDQRAVDRHQLQPFDLTLREQETVERVTRFRLRIDRSNDVGRTDCEDRQPSVREDRRHIGKRNIGIELAQPGFDRNFPEACYAYKALISARGKEVIIRRKLSCEFFPQEGQNKMGVE